MSSLLQAHNNNSEGCEKEEMTYTIHFQLRINLQLFTCMEFAFLFDINSAASFGKILAAIWYVVDKVKNAADT